jgi:hypothetical protein
MNELQGVLGSTKPENVKEPINVVIYNIDYISSSRHFTKAVG